MESIQRSALVPYTAEEMFALVSDIESYPRFLPWCSDTRVLSRDSDEVRASIEFSVSGLTRSFTTRNRFQVNKIIEIRLVDGPCPVCYGRVDLQQGRTGPGHSHHQRSQLRCR